MTLDTKLLSVQFKCEQTHPAPTKIDLPSTFEKIKDCKNCVSRMLLHQFMSLGFDFLWKSNQNVLFKDYWGFRSCEYEIRNLDANATGFEIELACLLHFVCCCGVKTFGLLHGPKLCPRRHISSSLSSRSSLRGALNESLRLQNPRFAVTAAVCFCYFLFSARDLLDRLSRLLQITEI